MRVKRKRRTITFLVVLQPGAMTAHPGILESAERTAEQQHPGYEVIDRWFDDSSPHILMYWMRLAKKRTP